MKRCECGHEHCCHKDVKEKTLVDPKGKFEFIRRICSCCDKWLGDKVR